MPVTQVIAGRLRKSATALWIAVLVLLGGAIVTERSWRWTYDEEVKEARQEFEHAADEAVARLEYRLRAQEQALYAGHGLHVTSRITRKRWQQFVDRLDLSRQFSGLAAMEFSPRIAARDLPRALAARRAEGQDFFQVFPSGARPSYQPVWYVAPESEPNLRALGYDMATDPARSEAMARARDRDVTAMSGKILLVQDGNADQSGFLMFHPLYAGEQPVAPDQRARRLAGFIVAATRMRDFMLATLPSGADRNYEMKVLDAAMPPGKGSEMFDSSAETETVGRLFHLERVFSLGGATWHVIFDSTAKFESRIDHARSTLAIRSGIVITLLLTVLGWSLASARARALRQIDTVTADLRASRERFQLAIAATEEGIWDRDLIARTTYLSPRVEEMLGHPPGGLAGIVESIRDSLHPDDVGRWEAALQTHLERRQPYDIEYRARHASGEWRWFRSRGQAVWDSDGKPVRMVGSLSDITETKESALHLEQQREFLGRLIDVIHDPIAVKDRDSRYVMVNRAYAEKMGIAAGEIVGRKVRQLLPENAAAELIAIDQRVLESGEDQIEEIRSHDARFGTQRIVVIKKSLTLSPTGEPLVVSIDSDITELRRALARFEAVIDDTPLVAVVGLDRAGRVEYWNRACEVLYELPRGEALGRNIGALLFSGDSAANFQRLIERVWTSGRPTAAAEYLIPMKSGRRVWIYSALYPVVENGVVSEVFGMGVDISARRQFEAEIREHRDHLEERVAEQTTHLLRAKDEAVRANQAKSEFLANMSHELRTPLHGVLSFARIGVAKGASAAPEKLVGYFERICQSGDRLLSLLNDLLDLSKLEAGKMTLDLSRQSLLELSSEVVQEFETLLESKPLTLVVEPVVVEPVADVDAARIKQVLRNLLSNAIKFTPPGRNIYISIAPAELRAGYRATDTKLVPALCLSVADEGVGVPEGELHSIFDKFVQSSRTRTGAGGTGLGLAICKEIVEVHRGTISVRNNAAGGATFSVVLPRGDTDHNKGQRAP